MDAQSSIVENLTTEQKFDAMRKMLSIAMQALKETPGGMESLGRVGLSTPDGHAILAFVFAMSSKGEL